MSGELELVICRPQRAPIGLADWRCAVAGREDVSLIEASVGRDPRTGGPISGSWREGDARLPGGARLHWSEWGVEFVAGPGFFGPASADRRAVFALARALGAGVQTLDGEAVAEDGTVAWAAPTTPQPEAPSRLRRLRQWLRRR